MLYRVSALCILLLGMLASPSAGSTQDDLKDAARDGKVAFILVTEPGATGVGQARSLIRDATGQVENSVLIEMDRVDAANADLVARYRLSGAPVPLILVVAPNGALAGGLPAAKATAERLVKMVPTPMKAEILHAIQAGKAVFVVSSRAGMESTVEAMRKCAAACGQLTTDAVTIQIDLDDDKELPFLTQLKVDPASKEPVTLVINKGGQISGSFTGALQVTDLVQAATKKVGGCCPPGVSGSKSCAPPKKK
jgi:hypothetical protein